MAEKQQFMLAHSIQQSLQSHVSGVYRGITMDGYQGLELYFVTVIKKTYEF